MNVEVMAEVKEVIGKLGLLALKYGKTDEGSEEYQTYAMFLGIGVGAVIGTVQKSVGYYDDCVKFEQALTEFIDTNVELDEIDAKLTVLEKTTGILPEYVDQVLFMTMKSVDKAHAVFEILNDLN